MIDEIIKYNKKFVEEEKYNKYITNKFPDKKIAILSCMDTRLTELLPEALGIKNGDVKIIKNAGGSISHPFGSVVRSLIVAIYDLGVEEIMIIGHSDCGVQHMDSKNLVAKMKARGISEDSIDLIKYCGINFESWLSGFDDGDDSVRESVNILKNHPLIPQNIKVRGFIMDSTTGELRAVD
ncbi:MAG: carbonic anhydrase [Proteocatella sp.]